MAITPALQSSYDNLAAMDKQIEEAESHLRVLRSTEHPAAIKMSSDLEKAKLARKALMDAISTEMNR